MKHCTPNSRCRHLECATCTWRYAGQVAQRIDLSTRGSTLHGIEIGGFENFALFRTAVRNLIDYRRRSRGPWGDLLLHVWHCRDAGASGIIGSGLVGIGEFGSVLRRRWQVQCRPVIVEELRVEIYRIVRQVGYSNASRYQHVKLAVWPRRDRFRVITEAGICVDPMPIIL